MKEKKQAPDWNIAVTHYLTAGFVVPLIIGFLWGLVLVLLLSDPVVVAQIASYSLLVVVPISLWLGAIYSAKYLNKTYIIKDKAKVSKLAAIYYIVLSLLYQIYLGIAGGFTVNHLLAVVASLIGVVVFYKVSLKHIKQGGTVS